MVDLRGGKWTSLSGHHLNISYFYEIIGLSPECLTFLSLWRWLACEAGLLELSPLENLFVTSTCDIPFLALPVCWFGLVTFESFGFTSDAA